MSESMSEGFNRVLRESGMMKRMIEAGIVTKQPSYRYFKTKDGQMFCWTTERMHDPGAQSHDKFAAFIYKPIGKGARSGNATSVKLSKTSYRRKRKDAKALALRWYEAHRAKLSERETSS